jgi:Zn-dependent peptidase ImmA (M78 family)
LNIGRLDLDGLGSPSAIAAKIHELAPSLPAQVPIEELCRRLDIHSITEIATGGFEAALIMDELKAGGAILVASGQSPQRRRFSLAHELGHFLIPAHQPTQDRPFECSMADLLSLDPRSRDRHQKVEAEANRFAAQLLMPPLRVRAAMRQSTSSLESIVAMARDFAVSKEAMARAWVEAHREPVAVIIAHRGRVLRQYRHEDFPWLPDRRGRPLPLGSTAFEATTAPGSYSAIDEIEPDVWLDEREAARTLMLTEQVLGQRDGYAMLLLQAELDED